MTAPRFDRRLFGALWLAGVVALLSLLAAPLEVLQPAGLGFAKWQFRLLSLVNPLILLTLTVAIGCLLAPRIGLDAPVTRALLARQSPWPARRAPSTGEAPAAIHGAMAVCLRSSLSGRACHPDTRLRG